MIGRAEQCMVGYQYMFEKLNVGIFTFVFVVGLRWRFAVGAS
jgi:hypothetical protein